VSVLVYHPDSEVRSMLAFKLDADFHLEVFGAQSPEEALRLLENMQGIQLLICRQMRGQEGLIEKLAQRKIKIACLVCHKGKLKKDPSLAEVRVMGFIEEARIAEDIGKQIQDLIQSRTIIPEKAKIEYCSIDTNLLIRVSPLEADIYVRLSDKKFIKLFREGDQFNLEDLKRYSHQKKVSQMYIKRSETVEFVQKLTRQLISILNRNPFDDKSSAEIAEQAHEVLRELTQRVGFTPEVQEAAKETVKLSMKIMGKSPRLAQILQRIQAEPKNYTSSHSMMVAQVACSIASGMEWHSESTFHKLTLAAFFHDFTLKNQELAAIQSLQELEETKSHFSKEELAEFRAHPAKAAELVRALTEVPPDVDAIVLQHHERPDASGFPRGIASARISPLSAVFIIAHDLVHFMIQAGDQFQLDQFLTASDSWYAGANFRKVHQAIKKARLNQVA
jgi:HD-GYP domain-containing protein (c-di-GMP phosphodiesterase class II)